MESLDRETLQQLNERVQVDGESIESVARAYLQQKRLGQDRPGQDRLGQRKLERKRLLE
jgi:hypothetical protein